MIVAYLRLLFLWGYLKAHSPRTLGRRLFLHDEIARWGHPRRPATNLLNTLGQRAWLDSDGQKHMFSTCVLGHLSWPCQAISLCRNSLQAESFAHNEIVSLIPWLKARRNALSMLYQDWNCCFPQRELALGLHLLLMCLTVKAKKPDVSCNCWVLVMNNFDL